METATPPIFILVQDQACAELRGVISPRQRALCPERSREGKLLCRKLLNHNKSISTSPFSLVRKCSIRRFRSISYILGMTPNKRPVGYSLSRKRPERGYNKDELKRFDKIRSRKVELYGLIFRFAFSDKSILTVQRDLGPSHFTAGLFCSCINTRRARRRHRIARENKPATIVGTRTAGQVLGGTGFKMGHEFVRRIPVMTFHTWSGN